MKANEFVKSTNIENVKFILDGVESEYIEISAQVDGIYMFDTVSVSDLKRLVEAHDLVESYGGLDGSKQHLNYRKAYGLYQLPNLIHAIKLVESC